MDMKTIYIFGIVALVLLSLGCVGGNQGGQGAQGGTGQGGGQAGTGGEGGAGTGGTGGTGGAGTGGTGTGGTGTGGQDLSTMAWGALIGLNQPVKCTFDYASEGQNMHVTAYVKGSSFREEINTANGLMTAIIKQNATHYLMYIDTSVMASQGMQTDCKWLLYSSGIETGTSGISEDYVPTSPESIENKVDYACEPGSFGDEKFDTPGKTCTMEELMQGYGVPQ